MRTLNSLLEEYRDRKVFLIDNLWYMHKCYSVMQDFQNADGFKTGHLYGMTNLITNLQNNFPYDLVLICEDCGTNNRKKLDENYKANREKMFEYGSLFDFERNLFQDLDNVYFCYQDGYEADDVLYSVSRIKDYNNEFIVFSGDNDMLQALDNTTRIVRKIVGREFKIEITEGDEYYNKHYEGLTPAQIPTYRAIIGDKSDNISPILPRFPRKVAKIYAKDNILSETYNLTNKEIRMWHRINETDKFKNNLEIMKLRQIDPQIREKNYKHRSIDVASYLQLFKFKEYLNRRV